MRHHAWASVNVPLRPPIDADEWIRATGSRDGGVWCHVKPRRSGLRLRAASPHAAQLDLPALQTHGFGADNGQCAAPDPRIQTIAAALRSTRASGLCYLASPSSATFWLVFHVRALNFARIPQIALVSPNGAEVGAGEADEEAVRLGPFYDAISHGRKHFSDSRARVPGYVRLCLPQRVALRLPTAPGARPLRSIECELLRHQMGALRWMLHRECAPSTVPPVAPAAPLQGFPRARGDLPLEATLRLRLPARDRPGGFSLILRSGRHFWAADPAAAALPEALHAAGYHTDLARVLRGNTHRKRNDTDARARALMWASADWWSPEATAPALQGPLQTWRTRSSACPLAVVARVDPASPAARAGICVGDVVLAVDGEPTWPVPRVDTCRRANAFGSAGPGTQACTDTLSLTLLRPPAYGSGPPAAEAPAAWPRTSLDDALRSQRAVTETGRTIQASLLRRAAACDSELLTTRLWRACVAVGVIERRRQGSHARTDVEPLAAAHSAEAEALASAMARSRPSEPVPEACPAALAASASCSDRPFPWYQWRACPAWVGLHPLPTALPRGGILADEVGLGKTVELMALLACHGAEREPAAPPHALWHPSCGDITVDVPLPLQVAPYPAPQRPSMEAAARCQLPDPRGDAARLLGWAQGALPRVRRGTRSLYLSRASLIVAPTNLLRQWQREMRRHAPSIAVVLYGGSRHPDAPGILSMVAADVVLVDYAVLTAEAGNPAGPQPEARVRVGRSSGVSRLVRPAVSPLLQISWWRLVLDEAQAVSGTTRKAAAMASQLDAAHRWFVTGTPVAAGGVRDLAGALHFLRLPFAERAAFDDLLRRPLARAAARGEPLAGQPLVRLLRALMLRRHHADIGAEMPLPPITIHRLLLPLNPVEREFYATLRDRARHLLDEGSAALDAATAAAASGGSDHIDEIMAAISNIAHHEATSEATQAGPPGPSAGKRNGADHARDRGDGAPAGSAPSDLQAVRRARVAVPQRSLDLWRGVLQAARRVLAGADGASARHVADLLRKACCHPAVAREVVQQLQHVTASTLSTSVAVDAAQSPASPDGAGAAAAPGPRTPSPPHANRAEPTSAARAGIESVSAAIDDGVRRGGIRLHDPHSAPWRRKRARRASTPGSRGPRQKRRRTFDGTSREAAAGADPGVAMQALVRSEAERLDAASRYSANLLNRVGLDDLAAGRAAAAKSAFAESWRVSQSVEIDRARLADEEAGMRAWKETEATTVNGMLRVAACEGDGEAEKQWACVSRPLPRLLWVLARPRRPSLTPEAARVYAVTKWSAQWLGRASTPCLSRSRTPGSRPVRRAQGAISPPPSPTAPTPTHPTLHREPLHGCGQAAGGDLPVGGGGRPACPYPS